MEGSQRAVARADVEAPRGEASHLPGERARTGVLAVPTLSLDAPQGRPCRRTLRSRGLVAMVPQVRRAESEAADELRKMLCLSVYFIKPKNSGANIGPRIVRLFEPSYAWAPCDVDPGSNGSYGRQALRLSRCGTPRRRGGPMEVR